jgi:hypothetical protein
MNYQTEHEIQDRQRERERGRMWEGNIVIVNSEDDAIFLEMKLNTITGRRYTV